MKPYRFLLLDADGTLLDFDQDMLHAFQATYAACFGSQRPYSPALLEQYETCNNRWWAKLERGECTKPQLFVGRFTDFLGETGLTGGPGNHQPHLLRKPGPGRGPAARSLGVGAGPL